MPRRFLSSTAGGRNSSLLGARRRRMARLAANTMCTSTSLPSTGCQQTVHTLVHSSGQDVVDAVEHGRLASSNERGPWFRRPLARGRRAGRRRRGPGSMIDRDGVITLRNSPPIAAKPAQMPIPLVVAQRGNVGLTPRLTYGDAQSGR
jgi:hypothetical protein